MTDVNSMSSVIGPLEESAGALAISVGQATSLVRGGQDNPAAIAAARAAVAHLRDQAQALLDRLDDIDSTLSASLDQIPSAGDFDPERWPSRRDDIAARLAADPAGGAAFWMAAWARAFLLGCFAEADRLAREPFRLPPAAVWCPDRLRLAPDALRDRSLPRLECLLEYLAAGGPLAERPSLGEHMRARALTLHARLLVNAGRPGAAALLDRASAFDRQPESEILAVRAALARTAQAEDAGSVAPTDGRAAIEAEDAGSVARRAWRVGRCAASAVEMFHAERHRSQLGADTLDAAALDTARGLVGDLPSTAGLEGALDVLVLPVPDEIWLAGAERAAAEGDLDAGRDLAGRVSANADPLVSAGVADLRVRFAKNAGDGNQTVADLLCTAGLAELLADHPQRAIEAYEEARRLAPESRSAALGLADALESDAARKSFHDAAEQLHRALDLLRDEYERQQPDSDTSWSLLTYSWVYTLLANQVKPEDRAIALWQAVVLAARAIAFEPSAALRWVRLSQALSALNCRRGALVAAEYASKLAPDDLWTTRNRIASLSNLGEIDQVSALLSQGTPVADGWNNVVGAIQLMTRQLGEPDAGKMEEALQAINEAVRIEPQNLWYHLVRADLLLRMGKPAVAMEDFQYLWRQSRLDDVEGLSFASRAAIELALGTDAVLLCEQTYSLAVATVEDWEATFNYGAALVLNQKPGGMEKINAAVALARSPVNIDDLLTRIAHLRDMVRDLDPGVDLSVVKDATLARAAQIEADRRRAPLAAIADQLAQAAANAHYTPELTELADLAVELSRAWCGVALGEPEGLAALAELARNHPKYPELSSAISLVSAMSTPGSDEADQAPGSPSAAATQVTQEAPILECYLPPSWFADLADPMQHEIIVRSVPDARARLRQNTGQILPGVTFKVDSGLEPAGFLIALQGDTLDKGELDLTKWYCPVMFHAALSRPIRDQVRLALPASIPISRPWGNIWKAVAGHYLASMGCSGPGPRSIQRAVRRQSPSDFPLLEAFPVPIAPDPLTALLAWRPTEVVARRIELAVASRLATATSDSNPPA